MDNRSCNDDDEGAEMGGGGEKTRKKDTAVDERIAPGQCNDENQKKKMSGKERR